MVFESNGDYQSEQRFIAKITETGDDHGMLVKLLLKPCRSEIDLTIADRICPIIFCKPVYRQSASFPTNNLELRDDIFDAVISGGPPSTISNNNCVVEAAIESWTISLRYSNVQQVQKKF